MRIKGKFYVEFVLGYSVILTQLFVFKYSFATNPSLQDLHFSDILGRGKHRVTIDQNEICSFSSDETPETPIGEAGIGSVCGESGQCHIA